MLKPLILNELNSDQRRETINTQQRFLAWEDARRRVRDVRGSMVWSTSKGIEYLARSAYDKAGIRRQTSLGPRSPETERLKAEFERGRDDAHARFKEIDTVLTRQAAINRALGLGRVPLAAARVLRSLADAGAIGQRRMCRRYQRYLRLRSRSGSDGGFRHHGDRRHRPALR